MAGSIRKEVRSYLRACQDLLKGKAGAHDEFILASEALHHKDGEYTDDELFVVQDMLHRVSVKLGG